MQATELDVKTRQSLPVLPHSAGSVITQELNPAKMIFFFTFSAQCEMSCKIICCFIIRLYKSSFMLVWSYRAETQQDLLMWYQFYLTVIREALGILVLIQFSFLSPGKNA